jgi:hypothetical protein
MSDTTEQEPRLTRSQVVRPFVAGVACSVILGALILLPSDLGGWRLVLIFFTVIALYIDLPICVLIALGRKLPPPKLTTSQAVPPFVIAVICGSLLAWLCYFGPDLGEWKLGAINIGLCLVGGLAGILGFDMLVCFRILIGHPRKLGLSSLFRFKGKMRHDDRSC